MTITDQQLRQIQLIELEALSAFDTVCREHNLRYYLAYGTLLGAIRHQGFIPWDDDLDVHMPRADYKRLVEYGQEWFDDRYFLQNFRTKPNASCQISELRVNGTVMKQKMSENNDIHHGVYIDIIPLDCVSPQKWKRQLERLTLLTLVTLCYAKTGHISTPNKCFGLIAKAASPFCPLTMLRQLAESIAGKYVNQPTGILSGTLSPYGLTTDRELLPEALFGGTRLASFEGKEFPIPEGAEEILSIIYGDYMTPPPEDQRKLRHSITELKLP